jgi:hypothetical protein
MVGHGVLDAQGNASFCCFDYEEGAKAYTTSLQVDNIKNMAGRIGIGHHFFHLDFCHAGGLFARAAAKRGGAQQWVAAHARAPAIVGATAVTAAQSALEVAGEGHGLFTAAVARGLRGGAFVGRDAATSAQLFDYVERRVFDKSDGKMRPQRKDILLDHFGEDCNGDMVFFRPGAGATPTKGGGVVVQPAAAAPETPHRPHPPGGDQPRPLDSSAGASRREKAMEAAGRTTGGPGATP